jgi:serine/threonine protein kinase
MGPTDVRRPLRVGDVVDGKYRLEETIGEGGMGMVLRATHIALGHAVALKVIGHEEFAPEAAARMLREARTMFRLQSEHTVRVLDAGSTPDGGVYIAMELLEGVDLGALLAERGRVAERDVAQYIAEACDALDEAHALGVVHRDLKPRNLFLAKRAHGAARIKVLDFGIAKRLAGGAPESGPATAPQMAIGTPRYMAPEQWQGAAVDARSDIYALGVVMYELLTGAPPLADVPLSERRARILARDVPSPASLRPELSEHIGGVVLRCLAPDPAARYASAALLARALDPTPAGRPATGTTRQEPAPPPPTPPRRSASASIASLVLLGTVVAALTAAAIVLVDRALL